MTLRQIVNIWLDIIFYPNKFEENFEQEMRLCPPAPSPSYPWLSSVLQYRHQTLRQGLRILKKRKSHIISKTLGNYLQDALIDHISELQTFSTREIIITSIPLSKTRLRERGFNQVDLLLESMASPFISKLIIPKILNVSLAKNKQSTINKRAQRFDNVRGTFAVNTAKNEKIKGRHIVLIDDITTSGATLSEARRVLLASGAAAVTAITIAH
ncbi:MAG: phosphoribosyltransferase family protein [Candidatus Nomurabacteria bacterium]|nr:phosphoribosyltransferase family protein [Candidatus Nomurabacteria bacterium]